MRGLCAPRCPPPPPCPPMSVGFVAWPCSHVAKKTAAPSKKGCPFWWDHEDPKPKSLSPSPLTRLVVVRSQRGFSRWIPPRWTAPRVGGATARILVGGLERGARLRARNFVPGGADRLFPAWRRVFARGLIELVQTTFPRRGFALGILIRLNTITTGTPSFPRIPPSPVPQAASKGTGWAKLAHQPRTHIAHMPDHSLNK